MARALPWWVAVYLPPTGSVVDLESIANPLVERFQSTDEDHALAHTAVKQGWKLVSLSLEVVAEH